MKEKRRSQIIINGDKIRLVSRQRYILVQHTAHIIMKTHNNIEIIIIFLLDSLAIGLIMIMNCLFIQFEDILFKLIETEKRKQVENETSRSENFPELNIIYNTANAKAEH